MLAVLTPLWFLANKPETISPKIGNESSIVLKLVLGAVDSLVYSLKVGFQAKSLGTSVDTLSWVGPYRECNAHVTEERQNSSEEHCVLFQLKLYNT